MRPLIVKLVKIIGVFSSFLPSNEKRFRVVRALDRVLNHIAAQVTVNPAVAAVNC